MVHFKFLNHSFLQLIAEPHIEREISDLLTFDVPGAKYMPLVRKGFWDGKTRLYNLKQHTTYTGLYPFLSNWVTAKYGQHSADPQFQPRSLYPSQNAHLDAFVKGIDLPFQLSDYQINAFKHAVTESRCLIVSPTASGKSAIIYLLSMYYAAYTKLIIVPTIGLVKQLEQMFRDYGYVGGIHCIAEGSPKDWDAVNGPMLVIATWQSIYKLPGEWFHYFNCIIGDEVHTFKAKSLSSIMEKSWKTPVRIGLTGTLDGTQINELLLEGLFGPVYKTTTTAALIEQGRIAAVKIKQVVLKHPPNSLPKKATYPEEVEYLATLPARNQFLINLIKSLKGNTLVFFSLVEKHGKPFYDQLSAEKLKARPLHFIHGETPGWERESVRQILETQENAVLLVSYGVFQLGCNITRIDHIIFASPSKSRIRVLQSIGRGLRLAPGKSHCTVFDIADYLPGAGKRGKSNYTLQHAKERAILYDSERLPVQQYKVDL